jgi:hypothetical protein
MRHQLQAISAVPLFVWALGAGGGFMMSRYYASPCKTVRALPSQHRLGKRDLACNCAGKEVDFSGLYLNRAMRQSEPVNAGDLSAVPIVKPPAGQGILLVGIRNRADLARTVNAGSLVALTDGGAIMTTGLPVLALVCDDTSQTTCSAAIAIPIADQPALLAASAKLQLLLINN